MGLDTEDEPRRGTSRANSVRFDESANHGYYGQASRSSSELPLRTSSGLGSHPLTERSLSHRSDGRQSSSGHSHHSARTSSLGLETSRVMGSSAVGSPLIPPPGLFLLGPVPCIIRCWLTTNFSNDTLLYAAVCSGSYTSTLGYPIIRQLGLEDLVTQEDDVQCIKLPVYLPEASIHQASSRPSSPAPQVPTLTIRFLVRDVDPDDKSIQIILGSDVLRSHNADVLFSQDKIIMVDDERNKVSVPLVRPESDSAFKSLRTTSDASPAERLVRQSTRDQPSANGHAPVGVIGQPSRPAPPSAQPSLEGQVETEQVQPAEPDTKRPSEPTSAIDFQPAQPTGAWGSWRRDSKTDPSAGKGTRGRAMKVLRPTKSSTRVSSGAITPGSATAENQPFSHSSDAWRLGQARDRASLDESRGGLGPGGKEVTSNPAGGASAFGWLNPAQQRR